MPPSDWRARVDDALQAAMVIGEAATHIPDEVQRRYPRVPWDSMRVMRNVVVHEYFGLSIEILWRTTHQDIPPLIGALEEMAKAEG